MWAEGRVLPFPLLPERREHTRAPLLVRVECRSSQNYVLGMCNNISENGLLIKAQQALDLSQKVTVRFVLPPIRTGAAIQANGVVVRVEDGGRMMALEFTGLRPKDREAIVEYVERNCRR
jgi:PilZ domain-containing protein